MREEDKLVFLNKLKGNSHYYKKYLGSPLRYAGGKSWEVGYIVEKIPVDVDRLISPFFGGGSLEIAVAKELKIPVLGFDIFDILVNYWQVQIHDPQALYEGLLKLTPDKDTFNAVKEILTKHWKGETKIEDRIQLATYFYFNHNLSYGPGFLSWPSSVYLNETMYKKLLDNVRSFHVDNLSVECASFEDVLPEFQNDFLYCDPPYYLGDGNVFHGIYPRRNTPIYHDNFNHEALRELLKNHKGGFILSYNDSPVIREWYKDYNIEEIPVHYTMGQGETRIGKNRKEGNGSYIKKTKEILIYDRDGGRNVNYLFS